MSFRERTAWITLATILICLGVYYGAITSGLVAYNTWNAFHLALVSLAALALLQVVLNLAASVLNPKDARTPRDERERMIHARSHIIGYYVLMLGLAGLLVSTHIPIHVREQDVLEVVVRTVNLGMLVMAAAAISVAVAQIVMYRRGY
jgi:hypothetical protein